MGVSGQGGAGMKRGARASIEVMRCSCALAGLAVALASPAAGGPAERGRAALSTRPAPGVTIDWTQGVVRARGVGPADRHAPSPAVARVAAERRAIDQARARLRAALAAVPRGGAALSPAAAAAAADEVERAPVVARDLGTDGSVAVELGLGLEAVRQAVAGPRPLVVGGDDGPAVTVVLDGRGAGVRPALGLAVQGGKGERWAGPMTFVTAPPPRSTAVVVERATADGLAIAGAAPAAGARVVVVVTQAP